MARTKKAEIKRPAAMSATSGSVILEFLSELGRATTAYHEAPPDRVENARLEYEEALRRFNSKPQVKRAGQ